MTQATQSQQQGILVSEAALKHVLKLREQQAKDLCLRVGVRQGGCSRSLRTCLRAASETRIPCC